MELPRHSYCTYNLCTIIYHLKRFAPSIESANKSTQTYYVLFVVKVILHNVGKDQFKKMCSSKVFSNAVLLWCLETPFHSRSVMLQMSQRTLSAILVKLCFSLGTSYFSTLKKVGMHCTHHLLHLISPHKHLEKERKRWRSKNNTASNRTVSLYNFQYSFDCSWWSVWRDDDMHAGWLWMTVYVWRHALQLRVAERGRVFLIRQCVCMLCN